MSFWISAINVKSAAKVNRQNKMDNTPQTYTTLIDLIQFQANRTPDKNILTFVSVDESGAYVEERRTFQQLLDNSLSLAGAFTRLGLGANQQVAVMMNNHPEFVETMIACSAIGATFVPIDPRTLGDKLAYMLAFTECQGVVCADYCVEQVLRVYPQCPQLQWLIRLGDAPDVTQPAAAQQPALYAYQDVIANGEPASLRAPTPEQPMFMMFTSGTTGNPKAVIYSHARYFEQLSGMKRFSFTPEDCLYTGLSLTHINAQNTLRTSLGLSVPAVISRKFTKSRLWDICRRYHCTIFSLLGGMIPEIYAMPRRPDDADNPVRLIMSSGMPAHIWEDFCTRFGVSLSEGYGATEGGGLSNPPGVGPVGSIGKPGPDWEAAILDEAGNPCPPEVAGEICFRRKDGRPIVVSYFNNPQASSDKVRDGWLHMGDIGHMDKDGWFYFHFRSGGGVRKNGDFVNTSLVEAMLLKSGQVADVFCYGVNTANQVAGEKILVAALVPADASHFNREQLLAYCHDVMEKNDVPDLLQVLSEIPKTISEKPIEKRCIELLHEAGLLD